MKNLFIYILIAATFCSCSKFLDQEPVSSSTDQSYWKDQAEAESGLAGSYALLRQALNWADGMSFFAYGDFPTDEIEPGIALQDFDKVASLSWNTSIPASETWRPLRKLRRYDIFYRSIDQANRCIKFIPTIPTSEFSSEEDKNRLIGEAYFLRAFNYFYISRVWGDVPLVDGSVDVKDSQSVPRNPANEVLDFCEKDIEKAIELLPWSYAKTSNRAVRANKGAAYALLAHLNAWRGRYDKCIVAADKVLEQSTLYRFVERDSVSYMNIYKGNSTEGIFEIAQSDANEGSSFGFFYHSLRMPYIENKTNVAIAINVGTVSALYDKADKRYKYCFNLNYASAPMCTKYANIVFSGDRSAATSVAVFKNNLIVFRYTDILLLKAEALAATGHFDLGLSILNSVKVKAGVEPSTNISNAIILLEEVFLERARELFLEGHRYYDLVRLSRLNPLFARLLKIDPSDFEAGKYYWPLDPTLLNENKQLGQTPFWNSKI